MMVEVRIELDAKFLIYQPDYTERQYHVWYPGKFKQEEEEAEMMTYAHT